MGKSAKVHKRTKKTASGASLTTPPSKPAQAAVVSAAKKKASKGRAKRPRPSGPGGSGPVLGGADYVDILLGSRRREREEAQKLPLD